MTVGALSNDDSAFGGGQYPGERGELTQALSASAVVTEEREQCVESLLGLLRPENDLPPLFEPLGCGVAIGDPAVDIRQRNLEQRRIAFQLVRGQIMERLHQA